MKILLLVILAALMLSLINMSAASFNDGETSVNNRLAAAEQITVTLLNDGFEGNPWAANWDGNGTTNWTQKKKAGRNSSSAAEAKKNNSGYFASDSLDTSTATVIKVSFWFKPESLGTGDMLLQLYNGSTYSTWYDLKNYRTYKNDTWSYFSENITEPQYFRANFRLRFSGSDLTGTGKTFDLDDVLVQKKVWR